MELLLLVPPFGFHLTVNISARKKDLTTIGEWSRRSGTRSIANLLSWSLVPGEKAWKTTVFLSNSKDGSIENDTMGSSVNPLIFGPVGKLEFPW
jgi:hypothetical protein